MLRPFLSNEFQEECWSLLAGQFAPAAAWTVPQPCCGRPSTFTDLRTPPRLTVPNFSGPPSQRCCDSLTLVPPQGKKRTWSKLPCCPVQRWPSGSRGNLHYMVRMTLCPFSQGLCLLPQPQALLALPKSPFLPIVASVELFFHMTIFPLTIEREWMVPSEQTPCLPVVNIKWYRSYPKL